jgi:ArsR family transcriptional regulator, arsenate/arsenite/antimonite-responsive transcriptional repressor / arsenate reductase (thioredoxin)
MTDVIGAPQPFEFLKLLAHDLRWKLVTALTQSDYRVQELVDGLQQPQNLISYHLKQLRDQRLVTERRSTADARDIYYSLDLPQLERLYAAVGVALHPSLVNHVPGPNEEVMPRRILFLCTENSARSQMAEGILRHLGSNDVDVFSAGTQPSQVHPEAVRVLAEMGIDISQQRAKHVNEMADQSFDTIITVCDRARENCPVFPGDSQRIHWSLSDPVAAVGAEAQHNAFEQTARQLTTRIRYFLATVNRPIKNQKEVQV